MIGRVLTNVLIAAVCVSAFGPMGLMVSMIVTTIWICASHLEQSNETLRDEIRDLKRVPDPELEYDDHDRRTARLVEELRNAKRGTA